MPKIIREGDLSKFFTPSSVTIFSFQICAIYYTSPPQRQVDTDTNL